jgi:hypothetical protein
MDRALDGLKTRAGAIFGFNTALAIAVFNVLKEIKDQNPGFYRPGLISFSVLYAMAVGVLLIASTIQTVQQLPNPASIVEESGHLDVIESKIQLISDLRAIWLINHKDIKRRASWLRLAIFATFLQLFILIGLMFTLAYSKGPEARNKTLPEANQMADPNKPNSPSPTISPKTPAAPQAPSSAPKPAPLPAPRTQHFERLDRSEKDVKTLRIPRPKK